ncbi:uncharacterized protein LOC115436060 [Sphaeramia orbicularis]|uniref:uncharacterized protein LOC115436060 n=1 Tax=Sphaeramia orbicularis TaxID=375764 RepID=UPI00117D86AB|nr:uncharacterized protein LOC115436060 [Sphaeramia orbicularis]
MMDMGKKSNWKTLHTVFLVVLMGAQSQGSRVHGIQISWRDKVTAGFKTTFTCSSTCVPKCVYTWTLKGRTFNGSTLTWIPDGHERTVELQCSAVNPQTGATLTTTSVVLDIKNGVSVQTSPPTTIPSLNKSLDLFCHDDTLKNIPDLSSLVYEVVWYKDGQQVILDKNKHQNNLTLHFDSLVPSDAGFYQCESYLPALRQGKVFSRGYQLSYDPWSITIMGPDVISTDKTAKFTCLTSCTINVDCIVRWQFRSGFPMGTFISVRANEITWIPSRPCFQNFTCVAENVAAGRFVMATKMVQVEGVALSGVEVPKVTGFVLSLSLGLMLLLTM